MSEFGFYSISVELASLDQLQKLFYLLENYFKILVGSQVSDRCPLGYLLTFILNDDPVLTLNFFTAMPNLVFYFI